MQTPSRRHKRHGRFGLRPFRAALLATALVGACGKSPSPTEAERLFRAEVVGDWVFNSWRCEPGPALSALGRPTLQVRVAPAPRFGGSTGCNSYGSWATRTGIDSLRMRDFARTLIGCEGHEAFENEFVARMSSTVRYRLVEDTLELLGTDRGGIRFVREPR